MFPDKSLFSFVIFTCSSHVPSIRPYLVQSIRSRPYLVHISSISRPYLVIISSISIRPYLVHISSISRPYRSVHISSHRSVHISSHRSHLVPSIRPYRTASHLVKESLKMITYLENRVEIHIRNHFCLWVFLQRLLFTLFCIHSRSIACNPSIVHRNGHKGILSRQLMIFMPLQFA